MQAVRAASVVRYVWAAPTTALGLLVLLLAAPWRLRIRVVGGVIEAHGPGVAWLLTHATLLKGGASALTLGHIVLGRDGRSLDRDRAHERVHVRQCERWGPLFVPAYLAASAWAMWQGGHFYVDNAFEREAFSVEGDAGPFPDAWKGEAGSL